MPSPPELDRTINTRIMNDTTSDRMYNLSSNTDLDVKHHRFRSSLWELSLVILFVYKNICIGEWSRGSYRRLVLRGRLFV